MQLYRQLGDLTDQMEKGRAEPWVMSDMPTDYTVSQLKGIVGFELPIARLHSLYEQDLEQFALIQMNLARELSRRLRATTERLVRTGNVPLF